MASGQAVKDPLCLGIYDDYDSLVNTENSATCYLLPENNTEMIISGNTKVTAESGKF